MARRCCIMINVVSVTRTGIFGDKQAWDGPAGYE
jgi:hypothetical protein